MSTLTFEAKQSAVPRSALRPREGLLRHADPTHWVLTAFLYLFFAVFLVWPILQIVWTGFASKNGSFTLEYVRLIFGDEVLRGGLYNATLVAVLVTLLTLAIALPLAILSVRY